MLSHVCACACAPRDAGAKRCNGCHSFVLSLQHRAARTFAASATELRTSGSRKRTIYLQGLHRTRLHMCTSQRVGRKQLHRHALLARATDSHAQLAASRIYLREAVRCRDEKLAGFAEQHPAIGQDRGCDHVSEWPRLWICRAQPARNGEIFPVPMVMLRPVRTSRSISASDQPGGLDADSDSHRASH